MRRCRRTPLALRAPRPARGISMLEGLIAGTILVVALLGGLQAILVASKQNAYANRMMQASTISAQTKQTLLALGRDQIVGTFLAAGNCADISSASSDLGKLAAELNVSALGASPCLVNLDDASFSSYFPNYPAPNAELFRRLLLVVQRTNEVDTLAVVVSWRENGRPRFHQDLFALYNPTANSATAGL